MLDQQTITAFLEKPFDKTFISLIPRIIFCLIEGCELQELSKLIEVILAQSEICLKSNCHVGEKIFLLTVVFCQNISSCPSSTLQSFINASITVLSRGFSAEKSKIAQRIDISSDYALLLVKSLAFFSNAIELNDMSIELIEALTKRTLMEGWADVYLPIMGMTRGDLQINP